MPKPTKSNTIPTTGKKGSVGQRTSRPGKGKRTSAQKPKGY